MSTVEEKKKRSESIVGPFTVEARHPRNCDVAIQTLGLTLRGAVSAVVEIFDKQWREEDFDVGKATRPAGAKIVDGVGEQPGMMLAVDPGGLRWKVSDPLYKDEKRLTRIKRALKRAAGISVSDNLGGVPPMEGKLDVHAMKTLCLELSCFVEAGEVQVVKGVAPTREEIEGMPGRFLLNWANTQGWHQPRFADQYDSWVDRMSSITGGE